MLHHTSPFFVKGNFDFETDNRSFDYLQSYSKEDLNDWVKKLEEFENTPQWYLTLKSYFVEVETMEQIQKRIETIKPQQAKLEEFKEQDGEQPWFFVVCIPCNQLHSSTHFAYYT